MKLVRSVTSECVWTRFRARWTPPSHSMKHSVSETSVLITTTPSPAPDSCKKISDLRCPICFSLSRCSLGASFDRHDKLKHIGHLKFDIWLRLCHIHSALKQTLSE